MVDETFLLAPVAAAWLLDDAAAFAAAAGSAATWRELEDDQARLWRVARARVVARCRVVVLALASGAL